MKLVRVNSCLSTGLEPALASARTIELEDQPLGQGGFGVAYAVRSVDGVSVLPQVAKVLFDNGAGSSARALETVRELQRRLADEDRTLRAVNSSLLDRYPALLAVPQLSFEGELDGRIVRGYCATNLVAAGLEEFARVLDDDVAARRFQSTPLRKRLGMVLQLVKAFEFLSSRIKFIHADIKAEALFVDAVRGRLAIIDFDSGALARDPSDTPTTFGTKQDWLAPEILRQLDAPTNGQRVIKVDLLSDVWAVNVAIHYLLTGAHPLFFLSEISERSMREFLATSHWPAVVNGFGYFRKEYAATYAQYIAFLKTELGSQIVDRLAFTINKGYLDPHQRTSYGQWLAVLQVIDRPQILRFAPDRSVVADSRPLVLSWAVMGTGTLELVGYGDVSGRDEITVRITSDTEFRLIMRPSAGTPVSSVTTVRVDIRPASIKRFSSSTAFMSEAKPVRLTWDVERAHSVRIEPGVGDVTGRAHVDVMPNRATTYTLTATNWLGQVTRSSLRIDVSTVPPCVHVFQVSRSHLTDREPAQIRWEVSGAVSISISNLGGVAYSGSAQVSPTSDTEYVLVATSHFGVATTARLAITTSKEPPAIERFIARNAIIRAGLGTELTWQVRNAERVSIQPGGGKGAAAGTLQVQPAATTTYVLEAETYFGIRAQQSVVVVVTQPTPLNTTSTTTLARRASTTLNAPTPAPRLIRILSRKRA